MLQPEVMGRLSCLQLWIAQDAFVKSWYCGILSLACCGVQMMLRSAVLCCAVLCCAVLCCVAPSVQFAVYVTLTSCFEGI